MIEANDLRVRAEEVTNQLKSTLQAIETEAILAAGSRDFDGHSDVSRARAAAEALSNDMSTTNC